MAHQRITSIWILSTQLGTYVFDVLKRKFGRPSANNLVARQTTEGSAATTKNIPWTTGTGTIEEFLQIPSIAAIGSVGSSSSKREELL